MNVFITGASSGLGRGLALWFSQRGDTVFAAARRVDALEALAAHAKSVSSSAGSVSPGEIVPVRLDVADSNAIFETVQQLEERTGGLDVVIANAGVGGQSSAKRLHWPTVASMIEVNVTGAAATLAAALPGMVRRNSGRLVGISSLASARGMPGSAAYCASKAFLSIYLEGLRVDLARTSVRVIGIRPGFVKSEMTAKNAFPMPFLMETDAAVEKMGRAILGGKRNFGFPWQMDLLSRMLTWMPDALWDRVASRMR